LNNIEKKYNIKPFYFIKSQGYFERVVCLDKKTDYFYGFENFNPNDLNSALEIIYQFGLKDNKLVGLSQLFMKILSSS
jgi:hypothetical protein